MANDFTPDHLRYPYSTSPDYPWDAAPDRNDDAPEEGWTGWVFVWDFGAWQYFGFVERWEDGIPFVRLPDLDGWATAVPAPADRDGLHPRFFLLKEVATLNNAGIPR